MHKHKRHSNLRDVHGILLFDKPAGLTSNAALQAVKRLYRARKAGHTGSLDPLATGLLPLCFGEATKISGFLLDADKHYLVRCQLGIRTVTGDAEGEVLEQRPVPALDVPGLVRVLEGFLGAIDQVPPMYSALKHKGERLYNLARQGVEVERQSRSVTIHALELLHLEGSVADLRVHCSKGTYVRTLCHDLGQQLGCGAHVTALRRLRVGCFGVDECLPLAELEARVAGDSVPLLSEDETLGRCGLPAVALSAAAAARVTHGVAPWSSECLELPPLVPDTVVRLRHDDRLLAVARYGGRPDRRGDFQLLRVVAAATSA